ncbi:MAG: bifunctional 4-hydroxy-2-oxoglutarate aldolase/2-dehydro-3-deoxy-phosphogluconate aldolase [Firmicutes bacterium]|nr:bifunctional 4-hydroxy-2-oxoglutarate aldolase/2-dehydro-3-deoxy-phosphogluconate aldolase [Bacillota bacterium]
MNERYEEICRQFYEIGIIPVIQLRQVEKAKQLAGALTAGGVSVAEVTFREKGAEDVIAAMNASPAGILAGAGTVLSVEQAKRAEAAGATFLVSPGFDSDVVEYGLKHDLPVFPGCVTPTEIQRAMDYGLRVLKFFPAQQYGGVKTIKALSAPYPQIKFMPTGGISLENLCEYLCCGPVLACGGSFMVKKDFLEQDLWEEVTKQCAQATAAVKAARARRT